LLLKNGQVNKPISDTCPGEQIRVAYVFVRGAFEIWQTVTGLIEKGYERGALNAVKYGEGTYEILTSFFTIHNLNPIWLNMWGDYGSRNSETGQPYGLFFYVSIS
jgi:hypothetical protein